MKEGAGISEHKAVFDRLLPQAKTIVTMRGEGKGGQRSLTTHGIRTEKPVEYKLDEKQRVEAAEDEMNNGTTFEIDPTIGVESRTIDLNFALTHQHAPAKPRWASMTAGSSPKVEARWMDSPLAKIQTALTLNDRSTRLIGTWDLDGALEPDRVDAMQAAFLRVAIVNVLPLADPRAEQMLKERGEAVEPTPKAIRPIADPNMPAGMTVRRFRIPPDFLSVSGGAAPAAAAGPTDPFASGGVTGERRFTRDITAEEILKSQGIPFPTGASANFLSNTSELVVRNTPASLDQVAAYVESIKGLGAKCIGISIHVVQSDAATIRRLERETLFLPDHSAAWQALEETSVQGKAKVVRSLWLETKGGQRATAESIIEYAKSSGLIFDDISKQKDSTEPNKAAEKNPASTTISAVVHQTTPVGLRVEVDPTIGADGKTVDLSVAIDYDYAPPALRLPDEPVPEQTQRLAIPQTSSGK
jgi:hypothetical protein